MDLLRISGYVDFRWDEADVKWRQHLSHVGEAMAEAAAGKGSDLGEAYIRTFENALAAVDWVIERAKEEKNLEALLTAAKVAAEIGEMQAKVADAIPVRGRGRPTKEEVADRAPLDLRDDDVDKALEDYKATT